MQSPISTVRKTISNQSYSKFPERNKKALSLGISTLILITFCYLISDIVMPFLIGALLAYILYPLTEFIQMHYRVSLKALAFIITIFICFVLLIFCLSTLPLLYKQLLNLYNLLKDLDVNVILESLSTKFNLNIKEYLPSSFDELSKELPNEIFKFSNQIFLKILNSTKIAIDIFMMLIISPLTCFFILKEWPNISSFTDKLLTDMPLLHSWIKNIDIVFRTFLRGQFLLALSFVFFYSIAFMAIGLNYALLLGVLAGLTCFLPYIGAIISFIICIVVGILQFGFSIKLTLLAIIFIIGHLLDVFVISPKLVGNKIGLHPLVTIFAMLASAKLFGLIGMFLAMPAAVIIQMILKKVLNLNEA